jgi:PAS domain S-box-containing protein
MKQKKPSGDDFRSRAKKALESGENPFIGCSRDDMRRLIDGLEVQQIELQLQNEELHNAHALTEESRMRYADLYDFAPVGYFTFDEQGRIMEVNLTGAKQLGVERGNLIKASFVAMVVERDMREYLSHLKKVFDTRENDTYEVKLRAKEGGEFYARLDSIFIKSSNGTLPCRTSVTDITERKLHSLNPNNMFGG